MIVALLVGGCSLAVDPPRLAGPEAYFPGSWLEQLTLEGEAGESARALFAEGLLAFRQDKSILAVDKFTAAESECLTRHSQTRCRLAIALVQIDSSRCSEAVEVLDSVIGQTPDDWQPVFHKWQALRELGRHDEAKTVRSTGKKLNPEMFSREWGFKKGMI